jgi:hypothetical protein
VPGWRNSEKMQESRAQGGAFSFTGFVKQSTPAENTARDGR